MLVGPAGTGKSYTAGALAGAWTDLTAGEGRVVGLAVSQIATQVLRDDGIDASRNITAWLSIQDRLTDGTARGDDRAWQLSPSDVVMVDEASMVATADLHRIHTLVAAADARMVLTGDPRQLGSVEAGGVMELLDGHAETVSLSDVRRFATDWEPAASLALRDGDPDALAVYDRHGRLTAHETTTDATAAAARAAVADRVQGRTTVVITGSNDNAAAIATAVRDQLISLGVVDPDHGTVLLGRDGCTAGVGDVVAARCNDYTVGVTNRAQYQVTAVSDDGSLTVTPLGPTPHTDGAETEARRTIQLPAGYVADDVQLGYASTVHGAQGLTVDAAHLVTDGTLDAPALYVGMTRGRLRNTAHVATTPDTPVLPDGFSDTSTRPSARSVLEGCLERDTGSRAATVEAELDAARLNSASVLTGRYEAVARTACRERLDRHLDDLAANRVLDADARTRLRADQGTEHLSRLLRAHEQAGHDPREVLTAAITHARGLGDADSVAQVLSHRITGGRPLPAPLTAASNPDGEGARTPADISPQAAEHLAALPVDR